MTDQPQADQNHPKKKIGCCLSCLLVFGMGLLTMGCVILLGPLVIQKLGIFGKPVSEVYKLGPDMAASKALTQAFTDREIPGVRVYVLPIDGEPRQGAFVILDSSKGYTGLSPAKDDDKVFFSILRDLSTRNKQEDLRISNVTVDYRDDQGASMLSFTVAQSVVDEYAEGKITRGEFFKKVHFDLLETLQRMGVQEFVEDKPK